MGVPVFLSIRVSTCGKIPCVRRGSCCRSIDAAEHCFMWRRVEHDGDFAWRAKRYPGAARGVKYSTSVVQKGMWQQVCGHKRNRYMQTARCIYIGIYIGIGHRHWHTHVRLHSLHPHCTSTSGICAHPHVQPRLVDNMSCIHIHAPSIQYAKHSHRKTPYHA